MYEVTWKPKARKQLLKIRNLDGYAAIKEASYSLQDWPDCRNVKPLANHKYEYRLRVGRYRILFDVQDIVRIIDIQEVKKRDESTY